MDLHCELKECRSWSGDESCLKWANFRSEIPPVAADLKARTADPAAEAAIRFLRIGEIEEREKREETMVVKFATENEWEKERTKMVWFI